MSDKFIEAFQNWAHGFYDFITYQLTIFRGSLLRRGLDPHLIDAQARDLEASIRSEFEKLTLATGDVA
jgi:hypothetical protein